MFEQLGLIGCGLMGETAWMAAWQANETQIAGHSASDICENLCSSVAKTQLVLTF